MTLARILFALSGAYLLIGGFIESFTPDGSVIEKPIYIVLYSVAAVLLLIGIFLPKLVQGLKHSILLRIGAGLAAAVLLFLAVTTVLIVSAPLFVPQADGSELFVLVMGAPVVNDQPSLIMQSRADLAVRWYSEHPDMPVLISGGKGGTKSEAETIADLMAEQGADRAGFFLENEATTTDENFHFAEKMIGTSADLSTAPVALLSNRFHVFRLATFASRNSYGNVRFVMADTPAASGLLWYAREVVLVIRYWFTGVT